MYTLPHSLSFSENGRATCGARCGDAESSLTSGSFQCFLVAKVAGYVFMMEEAPKAEQRTPWELESWRKVLNAGSVRAESELLHNLRQQARVLPLLSCFLACKMHATIPALHLT